MFSNISVTQGAEQFQCAEFNKTHLKEYDIQNLDFFTWPRPGSATIVFSEEKDGRGHPQPRRALAPCK